LKSGCVAHPQCIDSSSSKTLGNIPCKNDTRSASASTALTQVLHQSHKVCVTNCHPSGSGERNGAQKRTKVSFSETMMQALELLRLAKRYARLRTEQL